MSDARGPRAVVAGHGDVAAGLVSAAARVSGRDDAFVAVSNEGLDAAGIEQALRAGLAALGAHVIFTDLPAGSCTMAARRIARGDASVAVVTGANVAMLLDFALGPGDGADDLARIAARARDAVQVAAPREGARAD